MPREKDIDEPMADERDLMLLDLLYGERVDDDELDDGAAESSDEVKKLGNYEDLQADLEAFSDLRTLFRALPDEEPSPAVTSKLMHAAALHAPKPARAESGEKRGFLGWLAGLFQPIMTHPGLAAAASLVLIVAVTGTVYLSGEKQFAEPEISPTSVAQPELEKAADEAAPALQAPEMDPAARADNTQAEGLPAPTSEAASEPKADLDDAEFGDIAGLAKDSKAKRRRSNASKSSVRAEDTGRTARAYDGKPISELNSAAGIDAVFDDRSTSTRRGSGSSAPATPQAVPEKAQTAYIAADSPADESEADGDDQVAEIAIASQAPSPPPPTDKKAERQAPAKPGKKTSATQSKSKKRSKSAEPSQNDDSARIRSLHDEARSAAANNNCNTVREAGRMIQELDRRYYENTFRRDKKLSACFAEKSR